VGQAIGMLKAIFALHSYRHPVLDRSLYFMTILAAAGYFAVLGAAYLLDRVEDSPRTSGTWLGLFAAERWVWITPVVVVLAIYLSVIFQPGQPETGPVMYALF
jgi:hypothetical protein